MKKIIKLSSLILILLLSLVGCNNKKTTTQDNNQPTTKENVTTSLEDKTTKEDTTPTKEDKTTTEERIFEVDTDSEELKVGQTLEISAIVIGTDEDPIWTSSNDAVASVTDGVVTAKSIGTTIITATLGGITREIVINVSADIEFTTDEELIEINLGTWEDPTSHKEYGVTSKTIEPTLKIDGELVEDASYTFESQNTKIVTVNENGELTPKTFGSTTITVRVNYNGVEAEAIVKVKVSKIYVNSDTKFTFGGDKSEWMIDVDRFGFDPDEVISILNEDGDSYVEVDEFELPVFESGTSKAKVLSEGIDIESKTAPDKVIIETDSLMVEVYVAYVTENNVEFVSEVSPMVVGGKKQLSLYAFGIKVTEDAVWSVDKDYIATVDQDGTVTAVALGTATITAKVYGYTYTTQQVVLYENELTSPTNFNWQVDNEGYDIKYGKMIPVHGLYEVNDWISFSFTPSDDITNATLFIYYGVNNDNGGENFAEGKICFCAMASMMVSASMWDDSSFIIIDSQGKQVGSIDNSIGFVRFNKDETYTVYMKVLDDEKDNHDFFIYFCNGDVPIRPEQIPAGVVIWRDGMNNLSVQTNVSNYKAFQYMGETKANSHTVEGKYTFAAEELATVNTLDVASMGITEEVTKARIVGSRKDLFVLNSNGHPTLTDGKLTIENSLETQMGTSGEVTLAIETENDVYYVQFEITVEDANLPGATPLVNGQAAHVFLEGIPMVNDYISIGKKYVEIYAKMVGDWTTLYLQLGARHIKINKNGTYLYSSTWDASRYEYVDDNFLKIYDMSGNLVNDFVSADWRAIGSMTYGSVNNALEGDTWYRIVINSDGRAWGDDTCTGPYSNVGGFMAQAEGGNAYVNKMRWFGLEDELGIVLNKNAIELMVGRSDTVIASVANNVEDKTVTWSTSNDAVATVVDGVITATGSGTCTITATNNGKTAELTVTVKATVTLNEETKFVPEQAMVSWLPGTFDSEQDINGMVSNANIAPSFVPGDDYLDSTTVRISFKVLEDAHNFYLNLYELNTLDTNTWTVPDMTVRATVVGADYYGGAYYQSGMFSYSNGIDLLIIDETTGEKFVESNVEFVKGHNYSVTYRLTGDHSLVFVFTSAPYKDAWGQQTGWYHLWNDSEYCYSYQTEVQFTNIEFGHSTDE